MYCSSSGSRLKFGYCGHVWLHLYVLRTAKSYQRKFAPTDVQMINVSMKESASRNWAGSCNATVDSKSQMDIQLLHMTFY
jgi:hypothetical protein